MVVKMFPKIVANVLALERLTYRLELAFRKPRCNTEVKQQKRAQKYNLFLFSPLLYKSGLTTAGKGNFEVDLNFIKQRVPGLLATTNR